MLHSLTIKNIVVIEHVHLDFSGGLTTFTGETGAGKSILIDALALVLGERASLSLIRKGTEKASVSAAFTGIGPELSDLLGVHDIETENGLIIRRTFATDGKAQIFLNDVPVSLSLLKEVGARLINIHNQFDAMLLPKNHMTCIDHYGSLEKKALQADYHAWQAAVQALHEAQEIYAQKETLLKEIQFKRSILKKLSPKPHEENTLLEEKEKAKYAQKITDLYSNISTLFHEPIQLKKRLHGLISGASGIQIEDCQKIAALAENLKSICIDLEAHAENLAHHQPDKNLNQIEERLYALREAAFALGVDTAELHTLDKNLSTQEETLQSGEEGLRALKEAEVRAREVFKTHADNVMKKRSEIGAKLSHQMSQSLQRLKLPHAQFLVKQEELPLSRWTKEGAHNLEFEVSMNPGIPPGPLMKVASGGERSRLMLALKTLMHVNIPVLIFDEIDSGLGGDVATAMGDMMHTLAKKTQILCITHAPQIAAVADHHMYVSKKTTGTHTTTHVDCLNTDQRLEEIARMLSGKTITDASRTAARSLLSERV